MQNQSSSSNSKVVRVGPYRLGKTLGIGSFCKVKLAVHEITGIKVAIKILNRKKLKKQDMGDKFRTEIHILRMFHHMNIISMYEVIDEIENIFCVVEFVENGELFDYIVSKGKLDEKTTKNMFQQIISGIEYCHFHGVVHRDLKPENLLLDEHNRIKIVDFGLSAKLSDGNFLKTSCGSPNYAAPEVISGNLYGGTEVDVWSCGVILYALLCGSLPFDDENIRNLFKKIKNGIYTIPNYVSPGARDIISKMLVVDPLKRITIQQIMAHPWYRAGLPSYLAISAEQQIESETKIDDSIVKRVESMGFTREKILRALSMGVELTTSRAMAHHTEARKIAVIYNLLKDQQRKRDTAIYDENTNNHADQIKQSGFNSSDIEQIESTMSAAAKSTHRAVTELQAHQQATIAAAQQAMANPSNASVVAYQPSNIVLPAAGRWRLGRIYRDDPQRIMNALYVTLKKLNFEWKVLSLYRVKARYPAGLVDRNGRTVSGVEVVKFAFQLYRVSSTSGGGGGSNTHTPASASDKQALTYSPPGSASNSPGIHSPLFGGNGQSQTVHLLDLHKLYGQMFLFLELSNHLLTDLSNHIL